MADVDGRRRPVTWSAAPLVAAWLLAPAPALAAESEQDAAPVCALPDLSRAAASVRDQLEAQHAASIGTSAAAAAGGGAYGEMGKLLMAAEYLGAAEACFLAARAAAPRDRRWLYYLGHLYKDRSDHAASTAFFEQALTLAPDDIPTLVWLGETHLAQGRPTAAEAPFEQALELQPGLVAALWGLGRAALAQRDFGRAVERLEAVLAAEPDAASVQYPLAMAYRGLGDFEQARVHLAQRGEREILLPDPLMQELNIVLRSAAAYESSGIRALEHEEWEAAAGYFREAIALAPDDPSPRHRLGTALFLLGDQAGARAQFEGAIRLSPTFAQAHFSLGVLMASAGRFDAALARFSAAVLHDPAYLEARLVLADLLRHGGRADDALAHYTRAAAIDPRVAEARFGRAMALVQLQRYGEALDELDAGARAHPGDGIFTLAAARLLAAAPDDQVRDGRRALALLEGLPAERSIERDETLAMALAELGKYEEAAELQRRVIAEVRAAGWDDLLDGMVENLGLYESRQPSRTPWTERAMP